MNSLDTVEKLVQFGLEYSIAQQMVNSMNQTMQSVQLPKGTTWEGNASGVLWYVAIDGKAAGPYSEAELARKFFQKEVNHDTLVWSSGMPTWKKSIDVPEVLKLIIQTPPSL